MFSTIQNIDIYQKICSICQTLNKPAFPEPFAGPLQYGIGIKAFILDLLVVQMVSYRRVRDLVHAICDQNISEASMLKYITQLYDALARWEHNTFKQLLQKSMVNTDETSLKVNKKKQWIHVYASGSLTLKMLHPSRGKEAMSAINFIPQYTGTIVHDCWASYLSYKHCGHGLCGSHLLRELTFIVESNQYRWARNMKRLLKYTCRIISARQGKKLTKKEYERLEKIYRSILIKGEKEMPPIPEKPEKKRGKIAKSDAHNLWERLSQYESKRK